MVLPCYCGWITSTSHQLVGPSTTANPTTSGFIHPSFRVCPSLKASDHKADELVLALVRVFLVLHVWKASFAVFGLRRRHHLGAQHLLPEVPGLLAGEGRVRFSGFSGFGFRIDRRAKPQLHSGFRPWLLFRERFSP